MAVQFAVPAVCLLPARQPRTPPETDYCRELRVYNKDSCRLLPRTPAKCSLLSDDLWRESLYRWSTARAASLTSIAGVVSFGGLWCQWGEGVFLFCFLVCVWVWVRACVCACVRACVRVCVCVCEFVSFLSALLFILLHDCNMYKCSAVEGKKCTVKQH